MQKVLEEIITDHGAVVFNGDGYSDEWQIEAEPRGLPNLRTTLDALPELITDEAMELFSKYGVFNHREMHSRYEIALEQYALSIGVEARLTLEMATTVLLPAAVRYQTELATNVAALKAAGIDADTATLDEVSASITALRAGIAGSAPALAPTRATTRSTRPSTRGTRCCRRWPRCAPPPTSSRRWSPTTCGRSRPTRRCSSSSRGHCQPPGQIRWVRADRVGRGADCTRQGTERKPARSLHFQDIARVGACRKAPSAAHTGRP